MNERDFTGRRTHERKQYGAAIVFACKNRAYSGIMKNISLGGAFIVTTSVNQFSAGDLISLNIPFTSGKKHLKRRGRINWLNDEGFALEFF